MMEQDALQEEVAVLQRTLDNKERKMRDLLQQAGCSINSDSSVSLKQQYDSQLKEMEVQKETLLKEAAELKQVSPWQRKKLMFNPLVLA